MATRLPRPVALAGLDVGMLLFWAGVMALAVPTFVALAEQSWTHESGIHGPIVLATGLWLIARRRDQLARCAAPGRDWVMLGGLAAALLLYIPARAFDFLSIEVAALLAVGLALAYGRYGMAALRRIWFPLVYLLFLIPLPNWLVDRVTAPLKALVSWSAEHLLAGAGYNIVRMGVTLFIDQYQLLVEDACAGLNSLISLVAVSLFYIYLMHNASWRHALFLMLWIVPVAIFANIVRVIILVLVTHYFGDAAAQGFLHATAGILMFMLALLGIFALDRLFTALRARWRGAAA